MLIKIILSSVIGIALVLSASFEWRIVLVMLLVLVWRKHICGFLAGYCTWGYTALWVVLFAGFVVSLPRYFAWPTDRVRHYYISNDGDITLPPLHHWLLNVVLPEEELCNIGIMTARFAGPMVGIKSALMDNLREERERGTLKRMMTPYSALSKSFESPMSAAYVQGLNQTVGENHRSFYLIRPKHYEKGRAYPLVVFCHGYMGNWKLYNGVLKGLDKCIVISIGTQDLSGIYFDEEIRSIHSLYIPLLEKMGYKIEPDNVSVMGLSNGGSAVNEAYRHFSGKFANIVFISTPLHHTYPIRPHVLIIGGALDPSAPGMNSGYRQIKKNGGQVSRYWKEDGTHFIFATEKDSIVDYLNTHLGLK